MSTSDKPNDIRRIAKRSVPTAPPGLRRGSEKRDARWIGPAYRTAAPPGVEQAAVVPAGQVIKLSWADTFGRPARPDFGLAFRSAPISAQVLPFRDRASR
ncbi:hypothetical protein SAMN05216360_107121 [Methylobacterium phyllostachyos]|uniref:Uncharacterized protein n=1 Tax=Methylobacterium phyllostachyos TaxID=582672 RepID=A0A1H0A8V0_9HYPH|nr:hypothetical protein [Methylobacterium phyllostachyos]SDN30152.1 hypothetical protein SAMN05216360_107121 [Methylobacterium phyllostachyos]